MTHIHGYHYENNATVSPITLPDLQALKATVLFTEEDEKHLQLAGDVLSDQTDAILDLWYGFVGSHEHLVYYFGNSQGEIDTRYLTAVRARFGQWITDLCQRPYDQTWLNYQHEIALRHHRSKKNTIDKANAVSHIGLRYLVAFIYPITATIKPFLAKKGHSTETVEAMYQAWFKAVTLSVVLWSAPYVPLADF